MVFGAALLGIIVLAAVVTNWLASWRPSGRVTISLEKVSFASDLQLNQPMAVLVVTNSGHNLALVSFDTLDYRDKDGRKVSMDLPVLGFFGQCSIPPGTNRIIMVRGPSGGGPWRVLATVFLPSTAAEKARFAALQLWRRLRGTARYGPVWPRLMSPGYKISSPEIPALAPPPVLVLANTNAVADAEPQVFPQSTNLTDLDASLPASQH